MSARVFSESFGAGETKELPQGRFFYIKSAAGAVTVETRGTPGSPVRFEGIGAGSKFRAADSQRWRTLALTSATAQTVEMIIADDGDFDVANAVSVTGVATFSELPSSAVSTPAAVAVGTGAASTIAANSARRRITICAAPGNTGEFYVQAVGAGAGCGIPVAPGTYFELKTTAALDVRNDSGASQTYTVFEET